MRLLPRIKPGTKENRYFILANLATGHGITHWYSESFLVIMPTIKSALGLSDLQVGALASVRNVSGGLISIPAGLAIDAAKRYWGIILVACMVWISIAYVIMGAAPNYWVLLFAMLLISVPGTIWHLPGIAALSQRFPDKRGFALSIHGVGGNVGNAIGPLVAGALLSVLLWRHIFYVYAAPALITAFIIWWSLKNLGGTGEARKQTLGVRLRGAGHIVRNPALLGLFLGSLLRSMGSNSINTFIPIYLSDELGFSGLKVGLYVSMLTASGIFSAPVMGALSDRLNRKIVLLVGTLAIGILCFALINAGSGYKLILVIAGMGLFTYSLGQIIQAWVVDIVGEGTEATAIGLFQGPQQVISSISPLIAGLISDHYGTRYIFYYSGAITLLACLTIGSLPLRPSAEGLRQPRVRSGTPR